MIVIGIEIEKNQKSEIEPDTDDIKEPVQDPEIESQLKKRHIDKMLRMAEIQLKKRHNDKMAKMEKLRLEHDIENEQKEDDEKKIEIISKAREDIIGIPNIIPSPKSSPKETKNFKYPNNPNGIGFDFYGRYVNFFTEAMKEASKKFKTYKEAKDEITRLFIYNFDYRNDPEEYKDLMSKIEGYHKSHSKLFTTITDNPWLNIKLTPVNITNEDLKIKESKLVEKSVPDNARNLILKKIKNQTVQKKDFANFFKSTVKTKGFQNWIKKYMDDSKDFEAEYIYRLKQTLSGIPNNQVKTRGKELLLDVDVEMATTQSEYDELLSKKYNYDNGVFMSRNYFMNYLKKDLRYDSLKYDVPHQISVFINGHHSHKIITNRKEFKRYIDYIKEHGSMAFDRNNKPNFDLGVEIFYE